MLKLTKKKIKEYVKSGGVSCPYCDSKDIRAGETDTQDDAIFRNVVCENCGKQWTDEYTLTGMTIEEATE